MTVNVLHVGKFYYPYRGGMETVLRAICDGPVARATPQILVANNTFRTVVETVNGVKITRVASLGTLYSASVCPSFPLWLKRKTEDLVVLHEPNPLAVLSFLLVRPTARLIVWLHSDIIRQRVFYPLYRPLLERCLHMAYRVVVASPNHLRYIPVLATFQQKCVVIPYGIELSRFTATPLIQERVAAIRDGAKAPIVLFVGRLTYYKGLDYLIDAMEHLEAKLLVVGTGALEQSLKAKVRRKKLEGRVKFLGEVEDETLVACYHACDIFVLPSVERSEAFGVAQLEAMACGKPVVSTNLPSGVPWVNRDGKTGIVVEPRDVQALVRAINLLLSDGALRDRYGAEARHHVETEFTAIKMRERLAELYEKVLTE